MTTQRTIVSVGVAAVMVAASALLWGCEVAGRERAVTVLDQGIVSPDAAKVLVDAAADRFERILGRYLPPGEGGLTAEHPQNYLIGVIGVYVAAEARKVWRDHRNKKPKGT